VITDLPDAVSMRLGRAVLLELAQRYVWWKTPDAALQFPLRVVRQVLNLGTFDDMQATADTLGDDLLRRIVQTAEAGEFNARSWSYWHVRLYLSGIDTVPVMPQRKYA